MAPKMDSLSNQEPQDAANLADDFPSPEPSHPAHLESMDMSSELANQAAAQAIEEAVAASAASASDIPDQTAAAAAGIHEHDTAHNNNGQLRNNTHAHTPTHGHAHVHANIHTPQSNANLIRSRPSSSSLYPPRSPVQLSNSEQLSILRDFYARNPNPAKRDYEMLAEKTGRSWTKIREYFRQRRNKLRGLVDLEVMEEPGRASGWLQVTYKASSATSYVSQLNLYNSYKTRFDPYASHTPLLGGQELIQLACATFPGCEMAKDDEDYVLRGLKERETGVSGNGEGSGHWERGMDGLVEPIRAGSWLLSTFQHQADPSASPITQTDLYASYATRFSAPPPDESNDTETISNNHQNNGSSHSQPNAETTQAETDAEAELREFEANMAGPDGNGEIDENDIHTLNLALGHPPEDHQQHQHHNHQHHEIPIQYPKRDERLLNPVELITLTRMTFPKCEPAIDDDGRFIIRGLERREGVEKGRKGIKVDDMFPFALTSAPNPSDPNHPLTALLKRKLGLLHPDAETDALDPKRPKKEINTGEELGEEDKELLDGLKRFKGSALGKEVSNICTTQ